MARRVYEVSETVKCLLPRLVYVWPVMRAKNRVENLPDFLHISGFGPRLAQPLCHLAALFASRHHRSPSSARSPIAASDMRRPTSLSS